MPMMALSYMWCWERNLQIFKHISVSVMLVGEKHTTRAYHHYPSQYTLYQLDHVCSLDSEEKRVCLQSPSFSEATKKGPLVVGRTQTRITYVISLTCGTRYFSRSSDFATSFAESSASYFKQIIHKFALTPRYRCDRGEHGQYR